MELGQGQFMNNAVAIPAFTNANYKTTAPRFVRRNGKCRCGAWHSVLVADVGTAVHPKTSWETIYRFENGTEVLGGDSHLHGYSAFIETCACGARVHLRKVIGKLKPSHKCDSRCTEAKGFKCECACGGKNHGAGSDA